MIPYRTLARSLFIRTSARNESCQRMFTKVYKSEQTHSLLILICPLAAWCLGLGLHGPKLNRKWAETWAALGSVLKPNNNKDLWVTGDPTADHHRGDRSPKSTQGQGPERQPNIIMAKFGPDNRLTTTTHKQLQTYNNDRPCGIFSTLEIRSSFGCQANSAAAPLLKSRWIEVKVSTATQTAASDEIHSLQWRFFRTTLSSVGYLERQRQYLDLGVAKQSKQFQRRGLTLANYTFSRRGRSNPKSRELSLADLWVGLWTWTASKHKFK